MLTILFFTAAAAASAQASGSISGEREGSCAAARKCCDGQNTDCAVTHDVNFIRYTFLYFKNKIFFKSYFFSSNPCYCDHGCLDMGDCCPDFKQYCGGSLIFYSLLIHSVIHPLFHSFILSLFIHPLMNVVFIHFFIDNSCKTFKFNHLFIAYSFKNIPTHSFIHGLFIQKQSFIYSLLEMYWSFCIHKNRLKFEFIN